MSQNLKISLKSESKSKLNPGDRHWSPWSCLIIYVGISSAITEGPCLTDGISILCRYSYETATQKLKILFILVKDLERSAFNNTTIIAFKNIIPYFMTPFLNPWRNVKIFLFYSRISSKLLVDDLKTYLFKIFSRAINRPGVGRDYEN